MKTVNVLEGLKKNGSVLISTSSRPDEIKIMNFKARPKPQFFATSWLCLGFAETPITADKRLRCYAPPPKFALRANFIYPPAVIRN
jgi:hypothetical protein